MTPKKGILKNMRREEGKGSIKLILAVVAIAIVIALSVRQTIDFINEEKIKNLQADMLIVKTKVETLKGKNTLNQEENPLLGYQLTQIPENVDITGFLGKNIITQEEYEKYYLLDSESLKQMELDDLNNKYSGYFIVSYDDFEVIFSEGYENENGLWCYKISDIEKMPEVKNQDETLPAQSNEVVEGEENSEEQSEENAEESTNEGQEENSAEENGEE
ncbi:MAG: hypothetical protein IKD76_03470 [Clostridia bacterium]|nr:hypothetical protein [Clostridia bacterium]